MISKDCTQKYCVQEISHAWNHCDCRSGLLVCWPFHVRAGWNYTDLGCCPIQSVGQYSCTNTPEWHAFGLWLASWRGYIIGPVHKISLMSPESWQPVWDPYEFISNVPTTICTQLKITFFPGIVFTMYMYLYMSCHRQAIRPATLEILKEWWEIVWPQPSWISMATAKSCTCIVVQRNCAREGL